MTKKITVLLSFLFLLLITTGFAARIPNLNLLAKPVDQWHEVSHSQLNTLSTILYIGDNYTVTQDPVEDIWIVAVQWKEVIISQSKWKTDSPNTTIRTGQTHFKITPPQKDEKGKHATLPKLIATRAATPVGVTQNGVEQIDRVPPSPAYYRWIPNTEYITVLPPLLEWWYQNEILKKQK